MDIPEAIAEMEEELVKAMEIEFGAKVVANPFWAAQILFPRSMREHWGFTEIVLYTLQDFRREDFHKISHIEDVLDLVTVPFQRKDSHRSP